MGKQNQTAAKEHLASAKANDLHISTKHSVEICRYLRYKTTNIAKKILENVIGLKTPIPFKRFKKDVGHKPGMAAGRFPQKAAKEILKLIKTTETNAQFKGLNTSNLKISKILANKASIPMTGGRRRDTTKRTNLEIEVIETKEKKKPKPEEKKTETKLPKEGLEESKLSSGSEKGLENSQRSPQREEKPKTEEKEETFEKAEKK